MTKTNGTKKKRTMKRKLRNAICTTMSAIFMASAVLVAAIPVENIQANTLATPLVTISDEEGAEYQSNMPKINTAPGAETIYTSGDGMFQFVYVNRPNDTEKIAVIVGYSASRTLPGGVLTIPDTINGFISTPLGYVAANREGKPLYYADVIQEVTDEMENVPVYDEDGNITGTVSQNKVIETTVYRPCYYNDTYRDKWINLELDQFYYNTQYTDVDDLQDADVTHYKQTTTDNVKWVKDAEVAYIASEHVEAASVNGEEVTWRFSSDTETGVFSLAGNIVTLVTGDKLLGIGKNAFRGCSSLSGIELGNGTSTIHNYAFADCINIQYVDIDLHASVQVIGEHAFYNCQALESFTLPIAVKAIGDGAFEGCTALRNVVLSSPSYNVALNEVGDHVFRNCSNLTDLTIPNGLKQDNSSDLMLSLFEGCNSLQSLTVPDSTMSFKEAPGASGATFGFEQFYNMVGESFYFAGYSVSEIHDLSTEQSIAFKYLDDPYLYEKVVKELDVNGIETGRTITYRVDEQNNLRYFDMEVGVENVEIPGAIGPYSILKIGSESFQNNCYIKKITIPSSITSIDDYAFQGCHNLKDVIFEEPINITSIGTGAFNTQVVQSNKVCDVGTGNCVDIVNEVKKPTLTFTGVIDSNSVPFQYAMNPENNINRGRQEISYITFFSGWPQNLTVRYNSDTQLNELVRYPTYTELKTGALVDENGNPYPYMNDDYEIAAKDAVTQYELYKSNNSIQLTQDQWDIINAALNIELPDGITGIKEGIFSGLDSAGNAVSDNGLAPNNEMQSIRTHSLNEIPAYCFYGCEGLQAVVIESSGSPEGDKIGDYAFGDCDDLTSVVLSENVTQMGKRPFVDCEKLTHVTFDEGANFTCESGIIYGVTDGVKSSIVQCLETRGASGEYTVGHPMVSKEEVEGITSIQEEAFKDCTELGVVDLSLSQIESVPANCFENTTKLNTVYLPTSAMSINEEAFKNSNIYNIRIPSGVVFIEPTAFTDENGEMLRNIRVECSEDSYAWRYTKTNEIYGWTVGDLIVGPFRVMFFDWNGTILSDQMVEHDKDAVPPTPDPVREGYVFIGWDKDYTRVSSDLTVSAIYVEEGSPEDPNSPNNPNSPNYQGKTFSVKFYDWDNNVINEQIVVMGSDAIAPSAKVREGYNFTGWQQSYTNVQSDLDVYPMYEPIDASGLTYTVTFYNYDGTVVSTQNVASGGTAVTPVPPTREGYTFVGWLPGYENITADLDVFAQYEPKAVSGTSTSTSNSQNSGSDGTGNGSGGTNSGETYVVTVQNGSGSGSYTPGSTVTITAHDLPGQTFSNWASSATDFMISDVTSPTATFIMPSHAVSIVGKFIKTTTTTNRNPSSTASGNTVTRNPVTSTNGTRVDITKTGISDKNVASASVSGSSDGFVVKVTDDENARRLVEQALLAEYGSLDNIKYFAMDISLYDKTGKTKITNTDGLAVTITIPIPDALREYAGNNKTAGVVNGKLDKLNPRFTTIDGVPCVSFVATHFSPYTVYVDTANLTVGTIQDSTPTTGDPIHPKWFLVIGLALMSVVLFGARGNKRKVIIEV